MIARAEAMFPHPQRLIAFGPYRGDAPVATRAGISVFVPLVVLWLTGHIDLSLYSALGSFTSLYGRTEVHRARLGIQAIAGASLTASVVLGVAVGLFAERAWLIVPVLALWSGVISVLSDAIRLHPPGSLLQVFAIGACSSVAATPSSLATAALVSGGAALFSIAVTAAAAVRKPRRLTLARTTRAPGLRAALRRPGFGRYLLRSTVAPGAAGVIVNLFGSTLLGVGHPYWAMVAAVVPMAAPSTADRLLRAGHRLIGTFIGLALAAVLLSLHLTGMAAILVIVALQVLAELSVGRNYSAAVVFITPLALSMGQFVRAAPVHVLLRDRAVETVVGIAVAVVLTVATHDGQAALNGPAAHGPAAHGPAPGKRPGAEPGRVADLQHRTDADQH